MTEQLLHFLMKHMKKHRQIIEMKNVRNFTFNQYISNVSIVLSVFQIVKFKNDACPASDGNTGVCFTEAECAAKGGVASGNCASAFGVCCVCKFDTEV